MRFSLFTSVAVLLATAGLSGALPAPKQSPADVLAIQDTINLYALTVDSQQFEKLDDVFDPMVTGDFQLGTPVTSLAQVKTALSGALEGKKSFHAISTKMIDITDKSAAKSTAYFAATFFGQGDLAGESVIAYGRYEDTWRKDGKASWLITNRLLTYTVCFFPFCMQCCT